MKNLLKLFSCIMYSFSCSLQPHPDMKLCFWFGFSHKSLEKLLSGAFRGIKMSWSKCAITRPSFGTRRGRGRATQFYGRMQKLKSVCIRFWIISLCINFFSGRTPKIRSLISNMILFFSDGWKVFLKCCTLFKSCFVKHRALYKS